MREGIIIPNCTDIVQHCSKSGVLENIDLKDTWFTTDLEEDPSKTPRHEPILLLRITIQHSLNFMYNIVWPKSERLPLNGTNVQFPRKSETHQNERNSGFLDNHPMRPEE